MAGVLFPRKPYPSQTMSKTTPKISEFFETGIYWFEDSNFLFLDPVRFLNRSYVRFRVSSTSYYSRFFEPDDTTETRQQTWDSRKRKRKEKKKKPYALNERERSADHRHQEVRALLVKSCDSLLRASDLLEVLRGLRGASDSSLLAKGTESESDSSAVRLSLVELGRVWQSSLCEITLRFRHSDEPIRNRDSLSVQDCVRVVPIFNNLVYNETDEEVEAEFMNTRYVLPRDSCFYVSDLKLLHNLIPAENDCGYDLIVIDPPWENGSAHQKSRYPTLPNRYFLSLPINKLCHREGALVALWVTNREKLRCFVEEELFPAWGVKYVTTFYWLKVKPDGSLISDLDLFHHRPYECLILGQSHGEVLKSDNMPRIKTIPENQIIITIPGDYSRKPPVGGLLQEYVAGHSRPRCLELFAREMLSGWVSWGNEPLHFQESSYFLEQKEE